MPRVPEPDDEDDETWGAPELESAPAPPAPGAVVEEPEPPPQRMLDLGPPPEDAAGIQKWTYQMLAAQAYETLIDPKLSNAQRRKEMRVILAGAHRHFPEAAKFDLAQLIQSERSAVEAKKRHRAAAKLEPSAKAPGARVIPIRRNG